MWHGWLNGVGVGVGEGVRVRAVGGEVAVAVWTGVIFGAGLVGRM